MADYLPLTTIRTTPISVNALNIALRVIDPTIGVTTFSLADRTAVLKKSTTWTAPEIASAQTIFDTALETTPQAKAQFAIDQMDIFEKAIILTILDQFNLIRSKLAPPLPPITAEQMIAAVRTKAGTL